MVLERIQQYKIALADAINSPMGVVPDSAEGLLTEDELHKADKEALMKELGGIRKITTDDLKMRIHTNER